jgi:hypothetical protein
MAVSRGTLLQHDLVLSWPVDAAIKVADDWLKPANRERLRQRANELIVQLNDVLTRGVVHRVVADATVFVSALTERIRLLRLQIEADVRTSLSASKKLRIQIYS